MDLSRLNKEQQKAVRHTEGPLLILAGAGSGKTSTMTSRIAYMVEEKGVDPGSILAVTFTNKAAGEMRDRVEKLCGNTRGMWIMTFHAFCLRVLRYDADIIGYDRNFVIYDSADQQTVIKKIIKDNDIDPREFRPSYLLSVISGRKERGTSSADYGLAAGNDPKSRVFVLAYKEYEKALMANNAMDFDDLLLNAVRLFKADEATLLRYQDRFRYIMVDEYQDTNRIQYELIRMLAGKRRNLCVVGDDDQCIYEWRGADIRNILDFERDFRDARVIKLEQNYRSAGNILGAAHSVIRNNRGRKEKKLWTEAPAGHRVTYRRADDEKDEARYIGQMIEMLRDGALRQGRELKWSDFAVLYRANVQSRQFEDIFPLLGIPYRVLSGLRFYDRKEIKDMMCYMRLVVDPRDDLSLRRIINEPRRGIGAKTLEKLEAYASVSGRSLLEAMAEPEALAMLSARAARELKDLAGLLSLCASEQENLRVIDIYDHMLTDTGYLKALESEGSVESESRIENLMEFKTVINEYENSAAGRAGDSGDPEDLPSLAGFMSGMALMSDIDSKDDSDDAVVLMTLHSAKGLEFPVVFMPGMEDGLFPGHRSFDSPEGMEEERRLCYVGMTRARERLFLTSASVRTLYGRTDYTRESQFLRELDGRLLEGDSVYRRERGVISGTAPGPGVSTGSFDGFADPNKAGFSPFNQLKQAMRATRRVPGAEAGRSAQAALAAGDRVRHAKFGEGRVLEVSGRTVTVDFTEAGIKKMALGIAPLVRL